MKIDTKALRTELDLLANPVLTDENGQPIRHHGEAIRVTVVIDKRMASKVGIDERTMAYRIRLNSPRIRNQSQLDDKLTWVRKVIGGA
ncbi:hypothetical protein CMI37_17965 [Candidatus Pacearchaeota archaeon]|nr:hypothetical protein [Candidatus Pacearchaeota archaeon]